MFGLEEIADWWDSQHKDAEKALDTWVRNSSNSDIDRYGRAIVATTVYTSMALGSGLVDILRLGEGVKEGGWGYAEDGLRILGLAGPVFKLGRLGAAKWTYSPRGPWCASVATAKALRHTGNKIFVKASEIMGRTGVKPPKNMNEFMPVLKGLGAKVKEVKNVPTINKLKALTKENKKSVVLFAVRWKKSNGKGAAHALYAYRDTFGRFKIADRTGKIVRNLDELNIYYDNIGSAVIQGSAMVIKNAVVTKGTSLASMLAIEVNMFLAKTENEKEVIFAPVAE